MIDFYFSLMYTTIVFERGIRMTEIIPTIELLHDDGWSYKVKADEYETIIEYYEAEGDDHILKNTEHYTEYEDFDIKIAEAIIECRKLYKEKNK